MQFPTAPAFAQLAYLLAELPEIAAGQGGAPAIRQNNAQLGPRDYVEINFDALNRALDARSSAVGLRFVPQTAALLADGLSFEQRIAHSGMIATREGSLHDFYSALMWLRFPGVKRAINAIHLHGIAQHGTKVRSRHQQAVTHVDEAGAWVVANAPHLLRMISEHQWPELFLSHAAAWQHNTHASQVSPQGDTEKQVRHSSLKSAVPASVYSCRHVESDSPNVDSSSKIEARVFGHAIFELLHAPHDLLAAKVVWVLAPDSYFALSERERDATLDTLIATALREQRVSADPKLLSTLPLSGIPGWWPVQTPEFYGTAPCFRPKPANREYSPALVLRFD
jgi:hypothetical protein